MIDSLLLDYIPEIGASSIPASSTDRGEPDYGPRNMVLVDDECLQRSSPQSHADESLLRRAFSVETTGSALQAH